MVADDSPCTSESTNLPPSASIKHLRWPVTALLLGGLILITLGQITYPQVYSGLRWRVYGLMGFGLIAFFTGVHTMMRRAVPRWLVKPGQRLCRFFRIEPGQLVLLVMAPTFALMASLAAGEALQTPLPAIAWSTWLIASAASVVGSAGRRQEPLRIPRSELAFTVALLALALLLRSIAADQIPNVLTGDEGSVGLSALEFVMGQSNNPFSAGWFSFPSLYYGIQGLAIAAFGQTIEALRIPSALAGALSVVGLYWLARVTYGRRTAVLASSYLLVFHYHIHFSRIGLNNIWDCLFGAVAMAGLWHGWKSGRRLSFIISGIALGLAQYFYVTVRILPVLFLLWSGVALLTDRARFKKRLPDLILCALVACTVYLPLALFFLNNPNVFMAPLNRVTLLQGWLEIEMEMTAQPAAQILLQQMGKAALGFTHLPLRLLYSPGVPLLLAGTGALFLVGVAMSVWSFDLRSLLLLLSLVSVVVLSGLSRDAPASQRYIIAVPSVGILVALPLTRLTHWLQELWPEHRRFVVAGLIVVMAWLMWTDLRYYFFDAFENYTLGGENTRAATDIATYLQDQEEPAQDVYFFGFPRMGYHSLSTIPYLNPGMNPIDVEEPLQKAPEWQLTGPTIFIFLPERAGELDHVRSTYPSGQYKVFHKADGQSLFMTYEVGQR